MLRVPPPCRHHVPAHRYGLPRWRGRLHDRTRSPAGDRRRSIPQAPISEQLHYWLVEVGDGFAAFEGEPAADIMNPMGTVHGGWALTLIDSVTGCACYTTLPTGGLHHRRDQDEFSRPITRKIRPGAGRGRVIAAGRQIVTAEGW